MSAADWKLAQVFWWEQRTSRNLCTSGATGVEWSVSPFVYPFVSQEKDSVMRVWWVLSLRQQVK